MLDFRLYLISPERTNTSRMIKVLNDLINNGLKAFQWRQKSLSKSAQELRLDKVIDGLNIPPHFNLYANGNIDLAAKLGLTGVHLPSAKMHLLEEKSKPPKPVTEVRKAALPAKPNFERDNSNHATGYNMRYAVSTHNEAEIDYAQRHGAQFVTYGPIFKTNSKPAAKPLGLKNLDRASRQFTIPIVALGGITAQNAADCLDHGAQAVGVISAIWDAANPLQSFLEFKQSLGNKL